MADYKGHTIGGGIFGLGFLGIVNSVPGSLLQQTVWVLTEWQLAIALVVISVLFGLWPDVDTNSKGQNIFFGIAFIADIILIAVDRVEAAAYLGILAMTPIVGRHRGWTHSKLAMLLVPLPIVLVPYLHSRQVWLTGILIYGAAVSGYFSHLLLDGLIIRKFRIKTRDR
jgi:membrane-bound metal-dependent hydrolase YbcI (DUF457 family)